MAGTTLNIRGIDDEAAERIKARARIRGMTLAQYLTALVSFHDAARALADTKGGPISAELRARGLQTVTEE